MFHMKHNQYNEVIDTVEAIIDDYDMEFG